MELATVGPIRLRWASVRFRVSDGKRGSCRRRLSWTEPPFHGSLGASSWPYDLRSSALVFFRHSPGWVFLSSGSRLQGLRVHQIMAVPGACRLMIGKAYGQTVSALHPSRCSYRRIPSQCEWTTRVPSGRIETSPQQSMSWRAFLQTQPPRGTFEGDAGLSAVQISFRGEKSGVVPRSGSS